MKISKAKKIISLTAYSNSCSRLVMKARKS